ncbi:Ig-like domain-containing protein [Methanoregula sp.]|uniref:Ig-like domain-containing protein n=1 Tax=Methanoregula sp. TaxID=2052170 RepID=UPI002CC557C1|nr:Ig-like domain-containing protein [Methanoregula sp.]HVP97642.1 Ig-like domain-containing protein [Methanoregula sp.]
MDNRQISAYYMVLSRRSSCCCRPAAVLLALAALMFLIGTPSSATLVLTGTVFSPSPPLVVAGGENATSSFVILPSGATTFSRYHTLQMQTGLPGARWNIQVLVNGAPAAQQSASGDTAFVNGYLLSYPTTNDVSLTVRVNGTVPAGTGSDVTILQVTELDNGGAPVPGGSVTVSAPRATPVPVNGTGSEEPVAMTTVVSPTPQARSPGFLPLTGLLATVAAAAIYGLPRSRR